jgi:hypothetical protein
MVEYRLCEQFGWTYDELLLTPADIVEKFIIIMYQKAKKQEFDRSSSQPSWNNEN